MLFTWTDFSTYLSVFIIPLLGIILFTLACLLYVPLKWWQFRSRGAKQCFLDSLAYAHRVHGEQSPFTACSLYRLGHYYILQGELAAALYCFESISSMKVCQADPKGVPYHIMSGRICCALDRFEKALEYFELALLLRKGPAVCSAMHIQQIHHYIGKTYTKMGQHDKALEHYQEAVNAMHEKGYKLNMETAKSLFLKGSTLQSLSRLEEAATTLEEAIAIVLLNLGEDTRSSLGAEIYEKLGDICHQKGLQEKAREYYESASQILKRGDIYTSAETRLQDKTALCV